MLTKEEIQLAIHNARHDAIQLLVDFLDEHIKQLEAQYHAKEKPTESQIIAYYVSLESAKNFRHKLKEHQHADYVEFQAAKEKK